MNIPLPQTATERLIAIDGVINFRDIGGYVNPDGQQVRWGKAYRSAQLDRLSERGITQLRDLEVKTVVDLRFTEETMKYPTVAAAVPKAQMLSWHDERNVECGPRSEKMLQSWRDSLESGQPEIVREAMRINYPQKLYSHAAIYRRMLLALIEEETPLVFHCAAGK
ncbi:MAG: tyrosine-protein phosphatase, partial [Pseudomonadota bacterium]